MALTSGQVADEVGVNKETLRYYERRGLLAEPPRDSSNYRQYPPEAVDRLKFIQRAKDLGFTLNEIEQLLSMTESGSEDQENVLDFAEEKLREVRHKLRELDRLESVLSDLVEDCRGGDSYDPCPLIDVLTDEQAFSEHGPDKG